MDEIGGDGAADRSRSMPDLLSDLGAMSDVVTVIAGIAQILAKQHHPEQLRQLRQLLRKYQTITANIKCKTRWKEHHE